MSERGGSKLPFLEGKSEQWPEWKPHFMGLIGDSDETLYDMLNGTNIRPEAAGEPRDEWDKNNHKIFFKLSQKVKGQPALVVELHRDNKDGIGAWRALEKRYERQGDANKQKLFDQLNALKFSEDEDPEEVFLEADNITAKLAKVHGEMVAESQLLSIVRGRIPEMYKQVRTSLMTQGNLTYDTLKDGMIDLYHTERMSKEGDDKCLEAKFTGYCSWCGTFGHKEVECLVKKSGGPRRVPGNRNRNGRGGRGGRGRGGRGRGGRGMGLNGGDGCRVCGSPDHWKNECPRRNGTSSTPGGGGGKSTYMCLLAVEACMAVSTSDVMAVLLDSGATAHMKRNRDNMSNLRTHRGHVTLANGNKVDVVAIGDWTTFIKHADGVVRKVVFNDVIVVPDLSRDLLSVAKIDDAGGKVIVSGGKGAIYKGGMGLPLRKINNTYVLDLHHGLPESAEKVHVAVTPELWHQRFGHINYRYIRELGELGIGVPRDLGSDGICGSCQAGKHKKTAFSSKPRERAKAPLELVHTDVLGPIRDASLGGARYAIAFTDDYSRWRVVYVMKRKSEALACLKRYTEDMKVLLRGHKVQALVGLRSDNGGEYTGHDFKSFCKASGIRQDFSMPYGSQDNGVAERTWGVLVDMARTMRIHAGLGMEYWAEALNTAAYLLNRSRTAALGSGETPYYKLFGKHADVSHLRVFGCRAYVHDTSKTSGKFASRAIEGIMLGYDDEGNNPKCYRVLIPSEGGYRRTGHVTFDESTFPAKGSMPVPADTGDDDDDYDDSPGTVGAGDGDQGTEEQKEERDGVELTGWKLHDNIMEDVRARGRTRSQTRAGIPHEVDGDLVSATVAQYYAFNAEQTMHYYAMSAASRLSGDPKNYDEAMRSADRDKWIKADDDEYHSHIKNGTWELVPLPEGAHCIDSGWVYKTKRDHDGKIARYKARFIAKGFSQEYGLDYYRTYAPVASLVTIRMVLALVCILNLELHNADFDTAYLQSDLKETIYVRQPQGYVKKGPNGEELVCRLLKSLYGLKQSGRNWNQVIDKWLRAYGFEPSAADPCLYVMRRPNGELLIVVLYVDDMMIAGSSIVIIEEFKRAVTNEFTVKDLGELQGMIGMKITRNREQKELEISQAPSIELLLKEYGMFECRPATTPMEGILTKLEGDDITPDHGFMSAVGSFLYLAMVSRPDIAFAVHSLGKHMQAAGKDHWAAVQRLLRYLQGTKDLTIRYTGNTDGLFELVGYADADYAGDLDNRRSTSGNFFCLSHGDDIAPIDWMARQQDLVAKSSAESELISADSATMTAVHLRQMLSDLGFEQKKATVIMEDNQACIALSQDSVFRKRTRHFGVRFHYIREMVEKRVVMLQYIPTTDQLADILTKPLHRIRHALLRDRMMGHGA